MKRPERKDFYYGEENSQGQMLGYLDENKYIEALEKYINFCEQKETYKTELEQFSKQVLITSFSLDLSTFSFNNIERCGDVEELNLLKKWISNGDVLTLTLTKQNGINKMV